MLVFGTRPEAIKMAPIHHALRRERDIFEVSCCVTAQHRAMLDQVLDSFAIVPDIDLDLMRERQSASDVGAAVLAGMGAVLHEHMPDLVLVHGDTTTTMGSALAAFYAGVPVGHVEAGLRSGDLQAPFPEEFNRRVAGMAARFHFAPTDAAKANLVGEGCHPDCVLVTGNTVIDALRATLARIDGDGALRRQSESALATLGFDWRHERYVVVTCHRRESFSGGLEPICEAIGDVARAFPAIRFVYPVHANPAVREPASRLLARHPNIHLIAPLPYEPFLLLLRHCHSILTDSGGLQEEGPALGKPVLVMRDVTERPEAVAAGGVRLVGVAREGIVAGVTEILTDADVHARMAGSPNPYGDGRAAERIVRFLKVAL